METKDIYTASGGTTGGNMETKQVPGYVPVPVVNPDFVAPEEQEDQKDSGDSTEQSEKTEKDDGTKTTTTRKSTTSK